MNEQRERSSASGTLQIQLHRQLRERSHLVARASMFAGPRQSAMRLADRLLSQVMHRLESYKLLILPRDRQFVRVKTVLQWPSFGRIGPILAYCVPNQATE
jgi:hypothetical protein